jgi:hypothetical protein
MRNRELVAYVADVVVATSKSGNIDPNPLTLPDVGGA